MVLEQRNLPFCCKSKLPKMYMQTKTTVAVEFELSL